MLTRFDAPAQMTESSLKKTLRKTISLILGSNEFFSLEHRFLNFITLAITLGLFLALPINGYVDYQEEIIFPNIIFFVAFACLFYFSRIKKVFLATVWWSYITFIILSVALWSAEGGTSSPTLYTFISHLAIFMWIFPLKHRLPSFILLFVIISIMFFIEVKYPELIVPNPTINQTPTDQYLIFSITLLIIYLFSKYTRRNYLVEKEKSSKSDKLKSAFIANLSHEVRTPLNAILGFSELISDENATVEEKKEYKALIAQSSRSLLSLLSDMIELSRMQAGDYKAEYKICEPAEILKEIIRDAEELKKELHKEHILITTQIDFDNTVESDPFALKQIATNLFSNAIKFTHRGEIHVRLYDDTDYFILEFKDTGIGIRKEAQKIIFDSYRQVDDSTTRNYGGTGVGLSLTKGFVMALNGKIKVKSKERIGSTFIVSIPKMEKNIYNQQKT